jgi:hypothetical protein
MPGLFARLKNWKKNEVLTDEDINNEFNWFLQNLVPLMVDDYSVSIAQMQTQTTPGTVGGESLATSLAGEIERIRYMLALIMGETYWYSTPSKSLKSTTAELGFYFPFDGASTDQAWALSVRRGAMPQCTKDGEVFNSTSDALLDFDSSKMDTTAKFGNYSLAIGGSKIMAVPGSKFNPMRGTMSLHYYNYGAGDYFAYNPQLGIEFYLDNAGKVTGKFTARSTASETAKNTQTVAATAASSGTASWQHALLKYELNGINGAGTDRIAVQKVAQSETVESTALTLKQGIGSNGGCWFFGAKRNDPTWTQFSAMKVVPDAESVNPYTLTGSTATRSLTEDGLLRILTDTTNKGCAFSRTAATLTGFDLQAMTIEIKCRLKSYDFFHGTIGTGVATTFPFYVMGRDDSRDSSFRLGFWRNGVQILSNDNTPVYRFSANIDTSEWHTYRLTFGTTWVTLYIDGVYMARMAVSLLVTDATANDTIGFGDFDNAATGHDVDCEIEYFAWGPAETPPLLAASTGKLDDIAMVLDYITDAATPLSLSTTKASTVLGKDRPQHDFWRYASLTVDRGSGAIAVTSATWLPGAPDVRNFLYYPSDGITPMEISVQGVLGLNTSGGQPFVLLSCSNEEQYVNPVGGGSGTLNGTGVSTFVAIANNQQNSYNLRRRQVFPKGVVGCRTLYASVNGAHQTSDLIQYQRWSAVYGD